MTYTVDILQQLNLAFCYSNSSSSNHSEMYSMNAFTSVFSFWISKIDLPVSKSIIEPQIPGEPYNVDQ